jgi:hypothetical protein
MLNSGAIRLICLWLSGQLIETMEAETDSNATMYSCVYGATTVIVSHNLFKTIIGTRQQREN